MHRAYRRIVNVLLNTDDWEDIPDFLEVCDEWDSPGDGRPKNWGKLPKVEEGRSDSPVLLRLRGWSEEEIEAYERTRKLRILP